MFNYKVVEHFKIIVSDNFDIRQINLNMLDQMLYGTERSLKCE